VTTKKKQITEAQAKELLWRSGNLSWKLKGKQIEIYNYIKNLESDTGIILCARRTGKSFCLLTLANEICSSTPNTIIKYACPTQRMVSTILRPAMRQITADCPADLKPEYDSQQKIYRYPNGSEIQIAGTDGGNADGLRGGHAHYCFCDEAGFMDDLEYVVQSILLPTLDTTDGKLIMASTPNYKDANHEFHEKFVIPQEASGNIIKFTIYDSPMLTPAKIEKIIARYPGGVNNPQFRCEYLVEIPRSSENSLFPEFHTMKDKIVKSEIEIPEHFDPYVSMDIGFKDLTVAIFGFYDFKEAKLKILDELVMNGPEMTTDRLAKEIKQKEELRFYDPNLNIRIPTYLRVMDNDLKLLNDLAVLHRLYFIPTKKDNREAAVNNARMWIASGRVEIHERCKHVIYHLERASWNKARTDMTRLPDSSDGTIRGGHADSASAFYYLIRNILESKNPYPDDFNMLKGSNAFNSPKKEINGTFDFIKDMFNIPRKK
jgi:hypothetical protein